LLKNAKGYLSYIDVSVGEKVAGYGTQMGRLDVMCQNPSNAIVALGHTGGKNCTNNDLSICLSANIFCKCYFS